MLSVVAQDVVITIHCPRGVRPVRVLGRDSDIVGNRVVLHLNQLYAEHEKYVLVEVEVTSSEAGERRGIAEVEVVYANMATSKKDRLVASASLTFTDHAEDVAASENDENRAHRGVALRDSGARARKIRADRAVTGRMQVGAGTAAVDRLENGAAPAHGVADHLVNREVAQQLEDQDIFTLTGITVTGFQVARNPGGFFQRLIDQRMSQNSNMVKRTNFSVHIKSLYVNRA